MIKFFRNILSKPTSEKRSTQNQDFAWLFGGKSSSGIVVTKDKVIGDSAVWAALRILSNSVASLPWEVFSDDGKLRTRNKNHPVDFLINKEPNQLSTSYTFRQAMIFKMFLYGEAYVRIIRNKTTGRIISFQLLESSKVELFESSDGSYHYMVSAIGINGNKLVNLNIAVEDMIHLKTMTANGVTGIDIIKTHTENLGLSLAATQFGANFFGNGAHMSGVIESDLDWTPEGAKRYTQSFDTNYAGVDNVAKTVLLDQGMKYKKIGINPSEALLVEVRKFQIEEVARIFGIPAHMLSSMDKATFNNIEVMSIDFIKNTLRPLCVMIEQEFNRKLFTHDEKKAGSVYSRFNMDALMRGALKDRFDAYAIAIQNKIMNANEVRALENLNSREGGDIYENPMIQVNEIKEPAKAKAE